MECKNCADKLSSEVHREDIFAQIKQSMAYAQRNSPARHTRFPGGAIFLTLFPVIYFAIFVCISLIIAIGMVVLGVAGKIPLFWSIVPIAIMALGTFRGFQSFKVYQSYQNSPVSSCAVIITSKRTILRGGSRNISAKAAYYITVEYEDGSHREFAVMNQSKLKHLAEDDAGVLFTRSEFALDFDRVLSL